MHKIKLYLNHVALQKFTNPLIFIIGIDKVRIRNKKLMTKLLRKLYIKLFKTVVNITLSNL